MIVLSCQHVKKMFGLQEVLADASLLLHDGRRLGLVGVNGSGKSTLLKIISGQLPQDSGQVVLSRGMKIGMLEQHGKVTPGRTVYDEVSAVMEPIREMDRRIRDMEEQMANTAPDDLERLMARYAEATDAFERAEGYQIESTLAGVLSGLGFVKAQWTQQADSLSGGERTRLCLARLLLSKPDLLLLDEPTNHLDLDALAWLENYLNGYKGAVIMVTHDRYFLNAVCTDVAELLFGRIEQYEGGYSQYLRLRTERFEAQAHAFKEQQKELRRQEVIIARLKSYNREKSLKQARSREKAVARIERIDNPKEEAGIRFGFHTRRRSGEDVLVAKGISKRFDERVLFSDFHLHLRSGERVVLIGPNGIGKTTLLSVMIGRTTPDTGTVRLGSNVDIGYYDQHLAMLHPEKTILDEVWDEFPRMGQAEVRSILGCFLFTGDDAFSQMKTLSGGERARVALCKLMLKKDNLLLLDEPTNHLDTDSREVLEEALEDYTGTLIAVSHDRYFINRLATHVLEMTSDGAILYPGNYDQYVEKKALLALGDTLPDSGLTRTAQDKQKRQERATREAQKAERERLTTLEAEIAKLETDLSQLEDSLSDPSVYTNPETAKETAQALLQGKARLEDLIYRWAELADD